MIALVKTLMEKKNVTESTANAYVKTLYMLNGRLPFKTLTFLKNTDKILATIAEYSDNTQKSILSTIVSVLSLFKDKPTYKKTHEFYYDRMMGKAKDMKDNGPGVHEKSEKQKENWVSWEDVQEKLTSLQDSVQEFADAKHITADQFEKLLHYVILSLYTYVQPRRNQDYMDMCVVKKWTESMPNHRNYLDFAGSSTPKRFIFNKFKTAKKYGQQQVEIPSDLANAITLYLRHHPTGKNKKATDYTFLVHTDGSPLQAVNSITRVLNRIFGKRVGSSLLRHIYLSSKYDKVLEEQKADSEAMGHSLNQQRDYIKTDS
jgi:hypothetical protein